LSYPIKDDQPEVFLNGADLPQGAAAVPVTRSKAA